jgi:hypothetical protein
MADSLTNSRDGYVMTSIINTQDNEVEIREAVMHVDNFDTDWKISSSTGFISENREKDIITQLRVEHINPEEKKLLNQTYLDYQDIFYLLGDKLSSARAAQHSINIEPRTTHKHQALQITRNTETGSRQTS